MRPGSGSCANAAALLKLFTSGQPQMYAIRPTVSTYSGVMTVPTGVPGTSTADFGGGTCCAQAEAELLNANAIVKTAVTAFMLGLIVMAGSFGFEPGIAGN